MCLPGKTTKPGYLPVSIGIAQQCKQKTWFSLKLIKFVRLTLLSDSQSGNIFYEKTYIFKIRDIPLGLLVKVANGISISESESSISESESSEKKREREDLEVSIYS